jgi:methylase of polypeptide subunit release factors
MNLLDEHIKQVLKPLDFQYNQADSSSIYFLADLENVEELHPKIILDLDRAKLFKADAVYFRFFDASRLPQPQIYIYDNTLKREGPEYYANIHRDIWSASEIPLFIVIERSLIEIYDSRKPVNVKNNKLFSKSIEKIDLNRLSEYDEVLKRYNAQQFDCGSFWESNEAEKHFLNNKTAYEKLIFGLKSVRSSFRQQSKLSEKLSDHILILSILVKYLEENGIDEQGKNLAHAFLFKSVGYSSFVEVLQNNKMVELLDGLEEHFNGGLFQLSDSEKEELKTAQLDTLIQFLEGTLVEYQQMVLWAEYSFKYIPVELISNFYEEFLPKEKTEKNGKEKKIDTGAVYTPSFLVNFLVDECLPLSNLDLSENVKLIDISCGSGIFLVTAFKRLVQRWRIANRSGGKLSNTNPIILKKILKDNIFGVDIDKNATELTIFSLNLSLCSMLTPRQLWTELRFDDLRKAGNIIQQDFLEYIIENKPTDFDLVIGNPPFKGLKEVEYKKYEQSLRENNLPLICKIPDNQFALIFLDKAMDLLKLNGLLCLILPSGPLLYNNTMSFRSAFFTRYNIPQIIDFTFLGNILFEQSNVAVAALFAQKQLPDEAAILHITVKRTKANKEKNYFEIDHYDFNDVPKQIAKTVDFVWKSNLAGGGRIYNLIDKFKNKSVRTVKDFLKQKKEENHWEYGQGYKVGNKKKPDTEKIITDKYTIVDKYFTEGGIGRKEIQKETHFETIPTTKLIFERPHLLIKKAIGKKNIPIELSNEYLTFRNEIIGIHCPNEDLNSLEQLKKYFKDNNNLFRFLIAVTSSRSGISRSLYTSLTEDFFDLPYSDDSFALSFSEKIIINDVITYIIPFLGKGENSEISKPISDKIAIYRFSNIYCKALNTIYREDNKQYRLSNVYEGNAFFACEYTYTDEIIKPEYLNTAKDFSNLIEFWSSRNALIKRVLRIYDSNKIILIKPKQLRYWLESIALRDADETLNEAFDLN